MKPYTEGVINYTGNKSKLLKNIIPLLPPHERLVDCCAGGLSVTLNTSDVVLSNDINKEIQGIYQWLLSSDYETTVNVIESIIKDNKLSSTDKDSYHSFRDLYNTSPSPDKLLVLIYHSFSNQIRFNPSGHFNMPFGHRSFNPSSKKKLKNFYTSIANKAIEFKCGSFFDIDINNGDFVYIDPPYLATNFLYNTDWNEITDKAMMDWLDELDERGIKFGMSNVLEHRGNENTELKEWSKKYNVHNFDINYTSGIYHAKNTDKPTVEVYITNA